MNWLDLAVNFVVGLGGGALLARWAYRAGLDAGKRLGFEYGKAEGWREAKGRVREIVRGEA